MHTDDMFARYLALYESYLDRMIDLSEGVHLSAQYIHLHELDIKHATTYQMWHHLKAFVRSLGSLRGLFSEILFCFSREEKSFQDPENCTKNTFFFLKLQTPTKEDLSPNDFCGPDGAGADTPPKTMSIGDDLAPLLREYDLVQPYILSVSDGVISCENRLVGPHDGAADNIAPLMAKIGNRNTYQFSIYAYKLVDGEGVSIEERVLLRHAFVTHILAWNHDLRGAHRGAAGLISTVDSVRERWSIGQTAVEQLIAAIGPQSSTPVGRYTLKPVPVQENAGEALFQGQEFHELRMITLESFRAFIQRCRNWSSRGNPDLEAFVQYCGVSNCLGDATLTEKARLTWARGIWLATKLLTNRLLRSSTTGVWVDQVILSILFGLARSGQDKVPVAVEYGTAGDACEPRGPAADIRKGFFDYCEIADPSRADEIWSPCIWQVRQAGSQVAVNWSHSEGREVLASFVRGGLLRTGDKVSHELQIPARLHESNALARCLGSLSQLVWYLAIQAYPKEPGMLWLKQIDVMFEVDPFDGSTGSSALRVRLNCEGRWPPSSDLVGKEGSFSFPLGQLCRSFGQVSPNEAGKRQRAGVSVRSTGEGSDLLVVMNSGDAWK